MKDNEYKLLNNPEYTREWVEQELARGTLYFYDQLGLEDLYICDRAYGKKCEYPEKCRKRGCR